MEFLDKFNELTKEKYLFTRVQSVEIQKNPPLVTINLLMPYEIIDNFLTQEDKENIFKVVQSLIPASMNVEVNFVKSYIDEKLAQKYVLEYFKEKHPTILLEPNEITVKIENEIIFITINMKSLFYDFFKSYNVAGSMEEYMSHKFCNEIRVEIKDNKKQIDLDTDLATEDSITIISRKLRTSNHEKIVGKDIIDRAKYIIDCKDVEENAIYAGEVVDFKRMESKKTGNSYYVFKIDDSTGQLICKAFTKYKGEGEYDKIAIGDQIIVKGKVDIDTYLHDSVLMCRDVSRCCIDKTSVILKEELKTAPLKYTSVFPEQYEDFVQTDLFSENDNIIPEFLLSKTFVVFDFETTGLDIGSEVIELGAVKVENGVITQGFSTFVNPHMSIPENITELTNITDQDVQNAPSMDEVVADFYKFAENSVLVAHNISFDKMFLDKYAKLNRYLFSNKTMDTLDMAKKSVVCKNYKLGTLCEYFGIDLQGAHRAVNDCVATAKLFIELVKIGKY